MARPDGWRDDELLVLLQLLRARMTEYIYSTDETFASAIQRELPGQTARGIVEVLRELMEGFSFAMKTRKFTNEVLSVDGTHVYQHEHLYDTMVAQIENRRGGVWDPNELRTALRKMETYRSVFDVNPERFFEQCVPIWGKAVPDMRVKFYLWREIYLEEAKKATEVLRTDAELLRVESLGRIFENVPPPPSPAPSPSTPSPTTATPDTRKMVPVRTVTMSGKSPKSRPWTSEDMESFVQLMVDVTLELQTKGVSSLVNELCVRMNRTEPSLLGKVQKIRTQFEQHKRGTSHHATGIPSIIFDPASVAHKIFTADWSDRDEPYSFGILALKDLYNRSLKKRAKQTRPPPLQMEIRQRTSSVTSPAAANKAASTPKCIGSTMHTKPMIHPVSKSIAASASNVDLPFVATNVSTSSEFVRDCATMLKCDVALAHRLCTAIRMVLPSVNKLSRNAFFDQVTSAMGDHSDSLRIFLRGERILRLCEQRYGSLDCFAAAIEGNGETMNPQPLLSSPSGKIKNTVSEQAAQANERDCLDADSPESAATPSPETIAEETTAALVSLKKPIQSFGKSNEKAKQLHQKKGNSTRTSGTLIDRTDSSPSVQYYSPGQDDGYNVDGDDLSPHEEIDGKDNESDGIEHGEDEENHRSDETEELASSDYESYASSDFGQNDDVGRHASRSIPTYRHHGHRIMPGKVRVSSHKTLVVKHARHPCYCGDCEHQRHRRRGASRTSIHGKRSRSELYTEECRWVEDHRAVRRIAQRQGHYNRSDAGYRDFHAVDLYDNDPRESMVEREEVAELDSMWKALLAPIDTGIAELEAKRREQQERAMDRERHEREKHWKKDLRQLARDEWRGVIATESSGSTIPKVANDVDVNK